MTNNRAVSGSGELNQLICPVTCDRSELTLNELIKKDCETMARGSFTDGGAAA